MPYIYSTMSAGVTYSQYGKYDGNDLPVVERKVIIHGGANVIDKNLHTPHGVVTKVAEDELAMLEQNELFKRHMKGGFVKISKISQNPDKVAADMTAKDDSAQKTPDDFDENSTGAKPSKDLKDARKMDKKLGKMLAGQE